MSEPGAAAPKPAAPHPSALEPGTLVLTLAVAVVGAVIGTEIVTALGVTPNTSIIGVILAIMLSRLPLAACRPFRSIHRQNLVQTSISAATFGAANSLLVPVAIPVLLGRADLAGPMLVGATFGMAIDLAMLYWLFDTPLFPARAPWPLGVATGEAILAGDHGGSRSRLLTAGAALGVLGSSNFFGSLSRWTDNGGVPAAAFGLAFLGNAWALGMFGAGLLVRAYAGWLAGVDLNAALVPHGVMIGAGIVALGQAIASARRPPASKEVTLPGQAELAGSARVGLRRGFALYLLAGSALSLIVSRATAMSWGETAGWVVFAAVACIAAELIVGLSAMHAGWFPAFATTLAFLLLALLLGFPPAAAGVLAGFVAAGGPAFADAGFDFKTGWYIRGSGRDPAFERAGRRQQLLAASLGFATAVVLVALTEQRYFAAGRFPPVARVYAATIGGGIEPSSAGHLLAWAAAGALLQALGGPSRQLGILFATGLLIVNPAAGWAVLAGLAVRAWLSRRRPLAEGTAAAIFAAGLIAGDAVWAFAASLLGLG
jgi:uncharacterized oligopeptide transporter (OPT) family protein